MKTTIPFLAIIVIGMGSTLSSCQSKVNTSAHNEIDTTEIYVEEVDSATIIAEQKRIEAEKVAEAEKIQKKKEELERLAKIFKQQKEPIVVKQTASYSESFVIRVRETGKYYVYIPNKNNRQNFSNLMGLDGSTKDSIWKVQLVDIKKYIDTYKKATKCNGVNLRIEADRNVKYPDLRSLLRYLQDVGYSRYNLISKP